jgi:hypothetical protein
LTKRKHNPQQKLFALPTPPLSPQPVIIEPEPPMQLIDTEGNFTRPLAPIAQEFIATANGIPGMYDRNPPEPYIPPSDFPYVPGMKYDSPPPLEKPKEKKLAVLEGLYVIVRAPTEERLTARFENLSKLNFEKLATLAEDYMRDTDIKYRLRKNQGRSWKGAGKRTSEAQKDRDTGLSHEKLTSERTVRFSPFPSSTINKFKTLRKFRSDMYHRHCIVLERQEESFANNINILPYANAVGFNQDLQELNSLIDEANTAIIDFQHTDDWEALLHKLESYGVADYLRNKIWTVEHASMISFEIALQTEKVREHIESEYRKMFTEIDDEKAKAIDALHNEFEKGQKTIAEAALVTLTKEFSTIAKRIMASSKRQPERVKEDLERLRRKVVSIGLSELEPIINQMTAVMDDPAKMMELFGGKDLLVGVDSQLSALMDSI